MSSSRSEETRASILDAARALFETEGYHGAGLETVAKRAGVSRQAIYLHFDSKAALLTALHERINEQDVEPAMQKVWACDDARAAFDAFVAASATAIPRILGIYNALEPASRVEPVAGSTFEPPRRGRYADCLRLTSWLDREGELAAGMPIRRAADILFTLTNIPSYQSLVVVCGWSPRRWTTWTRELVGRAILADR